MYGWKETGVTVIKAENYKCVPLTLWQYLSDLFSLAVFFSHQQRDSLSVTYPRSTCFYATYLVTTLIQDRILLIPPLDEEGTVDLIIIKICKSSVKQLNLKKKM